MFYLIVTTFHDDHEHFTKNISQYAFHQHLHYSNAIIVLRTLLLFLIVSAIILTNIINIHMLRKTRELQTFSRVLLINLSVAGIVNGCIVCLPGVITSAIDIWPFGDVFCQISSVSHGACSSVTIWCLAAISLDRYVAIHHPVFYRNSNKVRFSLITVIFFWILGIILFSIPLVHKYYVYQYQHNLLICSMIRDADIEGIVSGFLMYILSAIVLFFSSFKVMVSLKKLSKTTIDRHGQRKNTRNANAIRILIISGISYFVSWGPYTITDFLLSFHVIKKVPDGMQFVITWLANANSFMNVLIYSGTSSDFRRRLKHFFERCLMPNEVQPLDIQMRSSMITSFSN